MMIREILFYNHDLDEVDFKLLETVLKILNSVMRLRQSSQHNFGLQKNEMMDYFVFSQNSPGLLLSAHFYFP